MEIEKLHFHTIDELRKENNITVESFCDDICSVRQYWRYLNGSNLCPPSKVTSLLVKLNMTYNEFYNYFYIKSHSEQVKLDKLYNHIFCNEYVYANNMINKLHRVNLSTFETQQFYDLCKHLFQVEFSDYSLSSKIEKHSKYINYPQILDKEFIGFIELNVLAKIAKHESIVGESRCTNYLYKIYKTRSFYISSNNRYVIPALLVQLSKIFGKLNDFEKSYDIANEGILYSINNYDSKALSSLYYLSALCEFKLGMRDKFDVNLVKCLATSISNGDNTTFQHYLKLIKKVFLIEESNLLFSIEKYIKKGSIKWSFFDVFHTDNIHFIIDFF